MYLVKLKYVSIAHMKVCTESPYLSHKLKRFLKLNLGWANLIPRLLGSPMLPFTMSRPVFGLVWQLYKLTCLYQVKTKKTNIIPLGKLTTPGILLIVSI